MIINISTKSYAHKPQPSDIRTMTFNKVELKVKDLCLYISKGHAFTNIFNNKGELKIKDKKIKNFKESWFIGYDVDHSNVSMKDFVELLSVKPTISYTTPSNGVDGYSFRLLYVLDEPITTNDEYKRIYDGYAQYLGINDIIDAKAKDSSRYFNGSKDCDIICNEENTICLNDIRTIVKDINEVSEIHIPILYNKNNKKEDLGNITVGCVNQTKPLCWIDYNKEIVDDFFNLDYNVFVYNYNCYDSFVNYEETPIELDEDEPFGYYPKDFRKIVRKPKYVTKNGKRQKQDVRLHDGEGRRRKLAINMIIRRLIYPNITFENLLYNIAYEISNYIDNSDGQLTKKIAFGICLKVMKYDLNDFYRNGFGIHKDANKMFINEEFCAKYGISKVKVRNMINATSLNMDRLIENYYVSGMTASELYKIMKEKKETISYETCRRYVNKKEEVKKITDEDIIKVIDTTKSYRNNVSLVSERLGIEIGKDKVAKLLKEKEKRAMKNNVFESDEEMMNFKVQMMKNKREREDVEKIDLEGISSVSEPLSSVDPTTIREEEKEEPREEINKFYVDIEKRIKPQMTWHEKDSVKGIIQMNLFFGRITNEEAKTLSEKNNCSRLYMVNVK